MRKFGVNIRRKVDLKIAFVQKLGAMQIAA